MNHEHNRIIFFDGVCNLCNASVQFIIKRDKNSVFRFSALQGNLAKTALKNRIHSGLDLKSVLLLEGDKIYDRSTAALRIAKHLSGGWPLVYLFIYVPKPIRDAVYNFIARNRYKWFGQQESCMIPTPELKSLFID